MRHPVLVVTLVPLLPPAARPQEEPGAPAEFDRLVRQLGSDAFRELLSAGLDRTVRLWDVATGKEVRSFVGHTDYVSKAHFAADGRRAVSCGHDRTARLWNLPE